MISFTTLSEIETYIEANNVPAMSCYLSDGMFTRQMYWDGLHLYYTHLCSRRRMG